MNTFLSFFLKQFRGLFLALSLTLIFGVCLVWFTQRASSVSQRSSTVTMLEPQAATNGYFDRIIPSFWNAYGFLARQIRSYALLNPPVPPKRFEEKTFETSPFRNASQQPDAAATMRIKVNGGRNLGVKEVVTLLPATKSSLWWLFHRGEVRAHLLRHPWIAQVEVTQCRKPFEWGCFEIRVSERSPRFLVAVEGALWLVASDGTFLARIPLSEDQVDLAQETFRDTPLVVVRGVGGGRTSPARESESLRRLVRTIGVVEREVAMEIETVDLKEEGAELTVKFKGMTGEVTFSGGLDENVVHREAQRLAMLFQQFGAKAHLLKTVNLSFERLAVVTLQGK